ncbi:hypothetical protein GCM10007350_14340 [Jeongeupia chitinilytica]|uniref:Uncharacterized protein n=2 Tax=Jeongeupia chitinilytica TaxID=1041641 RepID=A0ABQ3H047_9NEIS|nr:hypothetical protein GCM10007350_14340 [Jeongeupia chitinilytica]
MTKENDWSKKGNDAVGKSDQEVRDSLNIGDRDLSRAFKQDRFLSGGCPSDKSFSLMGHSVTMPLSGMCSWLQVLGNILVAITFIACVFIVVR